MSDDTATAKATFDWADLKPVEEVEQGYVRGTTIDVEAEIPKPIRDRVEASLKQNTPPEGYDSAKDGKFNTSWVVQECGTVKMAEEFLRLATRYAKYRKDGQITLRKGHKEGSTQVRFAAKPFEQRASRRLPGSESKDAPKVEAHKVEAPKAPVSPAPKPTVKAPAAAGKR